jgi:hypothetical protein
MARNTLVLVVVLGACGPSVSGADVDARASAGMVDATPLVFPDVVTFPDAETAMGPVNVAITADNAYSFGYGDTNSITHFTQGTRAQTAGQIFNCGEGPETYTIAEADAPDSAYLYVVSWDDLAVTQGVLGQFKRLTGTVYTGDAKFQVCATGLDYSGQSTIPAGAGDPMNGPTLDVINQQITICNNGTGAAATTSKGWVDLNGPITPGAIGMLAVGEANDSSAGTFPLVCQSPANPGGIDADAHWMWYFPNDGQPGDAFHSTGTNRFKAFLIFRLGVADIVISRPHEH